MNIARGYGTDVGEDGTEAIAEAERRPDGTIHFSVVLVRPDTPPNGDTTNE